MDALGRVHELHYFFFLDDNPRDFFEKTGRILFDFLETFYRDSLLIISRGHLVEKLTLEVVQ
jgi:hypothetical protein